MIYESFIAWLINFYYVPVTVVCLTIISLWLYREYTAKTTIIILKNLNGVYNLIHRKKIRWIPETYTYRDKTYVLKFPSYYQNAKPIYLFELDNPLPLSFQSFDAGLTSEELDNLVTKKFLTNLALGLLREKKLDILTFVIGIISGACIGLIIGVYAYPYIIKGLPK
ncbi:MAG: hypothetical protein QXK24_08380 [Ignisphaera sp.]